MPPVLGFKLFLSRSVSPDSLNLDKQTAKGSTALHYCCLTDNSECLKLLLRGKASIEIGKENTPGVNTAVMAHSLSTSFLLFLSISRTWLQLHHLFTNTSIFPKIL